MSLRMWAISCQDVLIRNVPARDLARTEALQRAWPHDISRAEALRIAITRGLDASPELEEESEVTK